MRVADRPSAQGRAERGYRRLLLLLPAAFRAEAGDEMAGVFLDGWRQAHAIGRRRTKARFWSLTLWDVLLTAIAARRGRFRLPGPRFSFPDENTLMIDNTLKDIRFALRSLRRSPGLVAVVTLTLGLAIGANTAIFSVVDAILFRPLPFSDSDRLVAVWTDLTRRGGPVREWFGYDDIRDLRSQDGVFEAVGAYMGFAPTLTGHGDAAVMLNGARVNSAMLQDVLSVEPALGRTISPDDDREGAPAVVMLSDAIWQGTFAADPGIVGRAITLDELPYTVIGVLPAGFRAPFRQPDADLIAPMQLETGADIGDRGGYYIRSVARLRPGIELTQANAALDTLATRREAEYPDAYTGAGLIAFELREDVVVQAAGGLRLLLAAVFFVLLMACVNIANLLLARGTSRRAELAVRAALGARRLQVVRQLLTETMLLALAGGAVGALLGWGGTRLLVALAPPGTPRLDEVQVDARVLAFAAGVTLLSALLAGLIPALRTARTDVNEVLKSGGRGADAGAQGRRLRGALVVVQMALALVLLVGAGLLVRSLGALNRVDLGFDPRGVLTMNLNLPGARYQEPLDRIAFYEQLEQRLQALPGVAAASLTTQVPLSGQDGDATLFIEGRPMPPPGENVAAWVRRPTPGYFETMGIPLLAGRDFNSGDGRDGDLVVIINETLQRRFFAAEDPLGKRITFGDPTSPEARWRTIVGVAHDVKNFGVNVDSRLAVYLPYAQAPTGFMFAAIRAHGDPLAIAPDVRRVVADLDPGLAVAGVTTMEEMVRGSLAAERFTTTLMSGFAMVAFVLAVIGLYGVISYGVGLRLHEMGVRVALGAQGPDIRRLIVGGSLALVAVGTLLGVAGAVAATRLMSGLLFGVQPGDPLTFAAVIAALAAAGLLAALLPARRAAGVDPVQVLNRE